MSEAKPKASPKEREDCHIQLGELIRALQAVGLFEEFIETFDRITERLKEI